MNRNKKSILSILVFFVLFLIPDYSYSQSLKQELDQRDLNKKSEREFNKKLFRELRRGKFVDNPDSITHLLDRLPSFSIYKDNYICTGFNAGHKLSSNTTDALFQLSFKQRVTKSKLPWDTHLFITYTQLAFWDIYKKSAPFSELNYNPTLALGKYFIKDNRLIGYGTFQFEHQSNGLDSLDSRDINAITMSFNHFFNDNFQWHAKVTVPVVLGLYTKDIYRYRGYLRVGADLKTTNNKLRTSAIIEKRGRWDWGFNFLFEAAYQIGNLDNIYAYMQFYSGYAQGILDYKTHENYLRVGIVLKPTFLSMH